MRISHRPIAITAEYRGSLERLLAGDLTRVEAATRNDSDLGFAIARHERVSNDHGLPYLERLLNVSIGVEAALGGPDRSDVALRLRTRAAELLGSPLDPPEDIFEDVKLLYDLRSKVAHGDPGVVKQLERVLPRVKTSIRSDWQGEQLALVLDRYLDLLRRAINVRIALGSGSNPEWPWAGRTPDIDKRLVMRGASKKMHERIRTYWERRGLSSAVAPPPALAGLIGAR
jgi:hypothetical protein